MMKYLLAVLVLVGVVGCINYTEPKPNPKPKPELSDYLALLKNHDQSTRATEDVFIAAIRVFAEVKFTDLNKSEVEALIGKPLEKEGDKWLYLFDTGEIGVARRLHFNPDGKVEQVEVIPTE